MELDLFTFRRWNVHTLNGLLRVQIQVADVEQTVRGDRVMIVITGEHTVRVIAWHVVLLVRVVMALMVLVEVSQRVETAIRDARVVVLEVVETGL